MKNELEEQHSSTTISILDTFEKGAPGFKFRGQLIKGFWQFWTDFFDIGTVGILRDSQNDSGGQTIKFCSFRGSNGVNWGQ